MTLILELPDNQEAVLTAKARAQGVSAEEYARQILSRDLKEETTRPLVPHPHISEVIRERMRTVPAELWESFPTDGASQHDHYIYGLPKRDS